MPILDFPSVYVDDEAASKILSVVLADLRGPVDPDQLSLLAAQDLAHLCSHGCRKVALYPYFQCIRSRWPVTKNATAQNVEPTDRPGF